MKTIMLSIFLMIGMSLFTCGDKPEGVVTDVPTPVSGTVKAGYRHLPISMTSDSIKLVVYRGDYVKFDVDDQGNDQAEYLLNIPGLNVSSQLIDSATTQPYFKMKSAGEFQFMIDDIPGIIDVVELRQSNYREVSAEEARQLLLKNPPLLLDVRTRNEYKAGYIKGAELIPLQELQRRVSEVEMYENQPILIYCATGNRSTTASKILLDKGFKNVINLRRGIVDWARQGLDIQSP